MTERLVLHIVNGDLYAGAERVQHHLAVRLPEFGYRVLFVCLKPGLFPTRLNADIEQRGMFMRSRLDLLRVGRWISSYARRRGVALIHSHTSRSALVGSLVCRRTGLPLVHHVHSPTSRESAVRRWDLRNSLVERLALRRASRLIPVSASLRQYLLDQGHPEERISTIPNGVPRSPAAPRPAGAGLTLGIVALYRPRKGVEGLLRAMATLLAEGHDVRLLAVGAFETPMYEARIKQLVTALGIAPAVEWLGYREQVFPEFRRMHALVLPSLYAEGMPMAILEAMAAGLPIVASRLEGIPEVVRHRQDGLLVPPGDERALTDAIRQLVTGRFAIGDAGASARARQQSSFSDWVMAHRVAGVYDDVVEASRALAATAR